MPLVRRTNGINRGVKPYFKPLWVVPSSQELRFWEERAVAEKREKTLSYRRAEWLTDIPKGTTLEHV